MRRALLWIRQNKLASALLAVVVLYTFYTLYAPPSRTRAPVGTAGYYPSTNLTAESKTTLPFAGGRQVPPTTDVANRLVVKESNLSLLVKDVAAAQKAISQKAVELGGYMVETALTRPQEAASGTISVRVPQAKFDEALDYFRSRSVKVVSENLKGQDVTDEYVDIQARLNTLDKIRVKFEEVLASAVEVNDILEIQRELINLQSQVDNLLGQQKYLLQTAALSKITVYLSTDEFELPYAPAEVWRPKVIFKLAIRSLVGNLRRVGTALIWIGVYSVIWAPVAALALYLRRRRRALK